MSKRMPRNRHRANELLAEVKSLKNIVKKQEKDIRALEDRIKKLESAREFKLDGARRSDDGNDS